MKTKPLSPTAASARLPRIHHALAGVVLAALVAGCNQAASAGGTSKANSAVASADAVQGQIRKTLLQRLPGLPAVVKVQTTPMPGLYELQMESGDILYSDAKGDFLLHGPLLDTKARVDLTAARQSQLDAVAPASLPQVQDAITVTKGKGERVLVVFADPRCPYCHRLEAELAHMDNITVHTFILPVLGEQSVELARQIWCAPDRKQAWIDWMLKRKKPSAAGTCDTSVLQRNMDFARKYRITGTPAMFFADGTRVSGFMPAANIEEKLKAAAVAAKPL